MLLYVYIVISGKPTRRIALKTCVNQAFLLITITAILCASIGLSISSSVLSETTSDDVLTILWAKGTSIGIAAFLIQGYIALIIYQSYPFIWENILKKKISVRYKYVFEYCIWKYTEEENVIRKEDEIRFKNKVRTKFPWLFKKNSIKAIEK